MYTVSEIFSDGSKMKYHSEKTQENIDQEICALMEECLNETEKLLIEKKDKVLKLTEILLEKESLDLSSLLDILGKRPFESYSTGDKFIEEYLENMEKAKMKNEEETKVSSN